MVSNFVQIFKKTEETADKFVNNFVDNTFFFENPKNVYTFNSKITWNFM